MKKVIILIAMSLPMIAQSQYLKSEIQELNFWVNQSMQFNRDGEFAEYQKISILSNIPKACFKNTNYSGSKYFEVNSLCNATVNYVSTKVGTPQHTGSVLVLFTNRVYNWFNESIQDQ